MNKEINRFYNTDGSPFSKKADPARPKGIGLGAKLSRDLSTSERLRKAFKWFVHLTRGALERVSSIRRWLKQLIVFSHDVLACIVAMYAAYCLRLGAIVPISDPMLLSAAIFVAAWTAAAIFVGVYKNIFRFAGSGAIFSLARATAITTVILISTLGVGWIDFVPRTISVIAPTLLLLYLFVSRLMIRYAMIDILEQFDFVGSVRRTAIYGTGGPAQQVAAAIRHEPGIILAGFVDDSVSRAGAKINDKPVWHSDDLARRIREHDITDIILASPDIGRSRRNEIIAELQELKVRVMMLPAVMHVLEGKISISDIREIQIEDLLGRVPVPPNDDLLRAAIRDRTVLVTGAGGSIGSELCKQIVAIGAERLILAEMTEFALYSMERQLREALAAQPGAKVEIVPELIDVTDAKRVVSMFRRYRPETVFHAAAYKHVPLIEANPLAGLHNNLFGTLNCARAAEEMGVERFVLVSTDKAVRPTNVMGASKRGCELILQALAGNRATTRFAMVRFGNVLGSSGSVVPLFREQISRGGPVTITHSDITRYFMTIPEAASLVIQAGAMAIGGEVYVLDMGEAVRIRDLAETMIKLSGATVRSNGNPGGDIEIIEIGLRPGEKLHEELLIGENPELTAHPRIMRASEHHLEWAELEPLLSAMSAAIDDGNAKKALDLIRRMVPEFQLKPNSAVLEEVL
jgi:FlaA1/EpsC-like NDP-sugar epimerase